VSPDGRRLAVVKADLDKESNDVWVFDVETGEEKQITFSQSRESAAAPAWSPDGTYLAYVALRAGYFSLYRRPSNANGSEELLYRNSGAPMSGLDWSVDGHYLNYFSTDLSGGGLYALPLDAAGERKPIEIFRSKSQLQGSRLSPDNRFIAYASNESGRLEVYVRAVALTNSQPAAAGPWQVSDQGGQGAACRREGGKDSYNLARE